VGWYQAEVILALDEMIRVKIYTPALGSERPAIGDGGAATWIEKESNKLAKKGTYTKNEKMLTHLYFMDLYKLIEPTEHNSQVGLPKPQHMNFDR
jgi:hypothetical protein